MTSIGIRLPDQEKKALAVIACQNDMTISQVLRRLIREYLDDVSQAKRASCQTCAACGAFATQQEQKKRGNIPSVNNERELKHYEYKSYQSSPA